MNEIKELKYGNTRCYCINNKVLIDTDWAGRLSAFFKCTKENNIKLEEIECLMITHFHPGHMGIAQEIADLGVQLIVFEEQKDFIHSSDHVFEKTKTYRLSLLTIKKLAICLVLTAESYFQGWELRVKQYTPSDTVRTVFQSYLITE